MVQTENQQTNCPSEQRLATLQESNSAILPGEWLGVLGGGQLGRMFSQAAQRLGYHVAVYETESDCPAGQVANQLFSSNSYVGPDAETAVSKMARLCKAVTLEFENVPSDLVRLVAEYTRATPGHDFLEVCQDRILEKKSVAALGCPTTPFLPVANESDARLAAEELDYPLVVKTARSGYDGKGQTIIRSPEDLPKAIHELQSDHLIAEKWIDYAAEVSMITARNASGDIVHYPLFENQHSNHILDVSRCPVRSELRNLQGEAEWICRRIAEYFSVNGLFCVEFFVTRDGRLLVNEIAPRPHNSGHLTIEAFDISQFEMQVRAICNLPLRTPEQIAPAAMANLLGDVWAQGTPNWANVLARPRTFLHLYGKSAARIGRKMGHITVLDSENAAKLAREARQSLCPSQL